MSSTWSIVDCGRRCKPSRREVPGRKAFGSAPKASELLAGHARPLRARTFGIGDGGAGGLCRRSDSEPFMSHCVGAGHARPAAYRGASLTTPSSRKLLRAPLRLGVDLQRFFEIETRGVI